MILRPIEKMLLELIERRGSDGLSTVDVEGYTMKAIDRSYRKLKAHGLIFSGKIGHRTMRLFLKQEWAESFEKGRRTVSSPGVRTTQRLTRAPWPADAPVHWPRNADGTQAWKHTVCVLPAVPGSAPIRTGTHSDL